MKKQMTQERWQDIPGYEGYYQASNLGRIRSVDRVVEYSNGGRRQLLGQIMRTCINKDGYEKLNLSKGGAKKIFKVHKLVAISWFGRYPTGQQVRHGPNGQLDNSVENLSYGTAIEDALDKIRDGTVCRGGGVKRPVRRSDGVEFPSVREAGQASKLHESGIRRCCQGRYKTSGGFGWEYI